MFAKKKLLRLLVPYGFLPALSGRIGRLLSVLYANSMNLVIKVLILLSSAGLYVVLIWAVTVTGLRFDLNNLTISNPVALLCTAILGTAATGLISVACDYKVLQYLGGCSLTSMCIHEPIKRVVIVVFGKLLGHFLPELSGEGVREKLDNRKYDHCCDAGNSSTYSSDLWEVRSCRSR